MVGRVAIQVSGQQRYGEYFPKLVQNFSVFEVDYFFHHWDGPRSAEEIAALSPSTKAIKIEPQIQFEIKREWRMLIPKGTSIFNLVSMTYGIQEANKLRLDYQEKTGTVYDLIIRARPDICLMDFPTDPEWFDAIPEKAAFVGKRPLYLTNSRQIQDQIAICRPDTMNVYAELYNGFDAFHAERLRFHPETYFYWWLTKNGIAMDESVFTPVIEKAKVKREDRSVY